MCVGPLCHFHRLPVCPNLEAILVHRLIPSRRECTQTNNCSNMRALICLAANAREGRQAVREAGGSTGEQTLRGGTGDWALYTRASQRIQAGMCPFCKPAGTHSQACQRPQPAQADVFWVLLFRFSGNCFPSGPASGTKCQVVLWEGVMERWKDRVY